MNPRIKTATGILIGILLVTTMAPQAAHAADYDSPLQVMNSLVTSVSTAADKTKDYVLDTLVWQVGNLAIQSMTKSVVNWINSGFDGSPAFVTDLNKNLQGVGDAVAGRFFKELSKETAATPFQNPVLDSVRLAYYLRTSPESFYTRYPYTLNQVSGNDRAFLKGDFTQGGFNAWFATIMNPQNNPFGAQMLANQALENAVAGATGTRLEELSWNRGYLSWRGECLAKKPLSTPEQAAADASSVPLGGEENCYDYEIRTAGGTIMDVLTDRLGDNVNRLVSADEFNEVIGALLNQLTLQVLGGGDGGGLAGTSKPSTGGGSSYITRATDPNASGSGNIGATFAATVTRQQKQVEEFRTSWEKIRAAAQTAKDRCGVTTEPNPQTVIDRAQAMLVKAAGAATELDAIASAVAKANAAGGNQSIALLGISESYNTLTNCTDIAVAKGECKAALPSPEEIAEAQTGSQDTGSADPGSLYSQMNRLASSRTCSTSSN